MKIEWNKKESKKVPYGDVYPGKVILVNDRLCIKGDTHGVSGKVCVDLEDGTVYSYDTSTQVVIVNAHVVVEE